MIRLEIVDRYGRTVPGALFETEYYAGVMNLQPDIFGWPDGYRIQCTVSAAATPEVPPAEGTPE